jgi:diketogulonate reductase-like aldo/keto reductase
MCVLCAAMAQVYGAVEASTLAMPKLMYGTAWKKERTRELVLLALRAGFRGIDTACQPKHYYEPGVGEALDAAIRSGLIERRAVFVQTKFTPLVGQDPARVPYERDAQIGEQVRQSFEASLQNLRVEYVDALVLHSPYPTLDETLAAWRAMEAIHASGRARALGISNCYSLETLRGLYERAAVKPSIVQNRFYAATGFDRELREWCGAAGGVRHQSFWTLTANPHAIGAPAVRVLAAKRGASAEALFFKYVMQLGITPLTGTSSREHMRADLAALTMADLSEAEMATIGRALDSVPKGPRES